MLEVNASGLAMAVKVFMFGLVHQWPSRLGVHTIHFEKFIMGEVDLIYLISKTKQQGAREKEHASLSLQLNFLKLIQSNCTRYFGGQCNIAIGGYSARESDRSN